jgi:SAM-dependent methyltransferase
MRTHFHYTEDEALVYDQRATLDIPCYSEIHEFFRTHCPYDDELPQVRYLELGVGTGNLTDVILNGHDNVVVDAYDRSFTMLEIASRKLARFGSRVRLCHSDVFAAHFPQGYDAATLFLCEEQSRILSHEFLARIAFCLKPRGCFVFCSCNRAALALATGSLESWTILSPFFIKQAARVCGRFAVCKLDWAADFPRRSLPNTDAVPPAHLLRTPHHQQ